MNEQSLIYGGIAGLVIIVVVFAVIESGALDDELGTKNLSENLSESSGLEADTPEQRNEKFSDDGQTEEKIALIGNS